LRGGIIAVTKAFPEIGCARRKTKHKQDANQHNKLFHIFLLSGNSSALFSCSGWGDNTVYHISNGYILLQPPTAA
jgi:hypothetical protein